MIMRQHKGGVWPTPTQELLLKATLLSGAEADHALQAWLTATDLDALDESSARLLPLLFRRLMARGVDVPHMARFQEAYRTTWLKNQLLFRRAAQILCQLHEAGTPTLLLKGATLALAYYKDHGVRPMNDFDFLIPVDQAPTVLGMLLDSGFEAMEYTWPDGLRHAMQTEVRNGQNFRDPQGFELDIHWHIFSEGWAGRDSDRDFWEEAQAITVLGVETLTLNPTDLLLHVCVHGAKWHHTRVLRWAADAMQILEVAADQIDWERLAAQARKFEMVQPLRDALTYLRDVLHAPIPDQALTALASIPVGRLARLHYWAWCSYPGPIPIMIRLTFWYMRFARARNAHRFPRILLGIPAFLQYRWGVPNLWLVLPISIANTIRRLFRQPKIKLTPTNGRAS